MTAVLQLINDTAVLLAKNRTCLPLSSESDYCSVCNLLELQLDE